MRRCYSPPRAACLALATRRKDARHPVRLPHACLTQPDQGGPMRIHNFLDNDDAKTIAEKGPFKVIEWQRDLSVPYLGAQA